jgi:hypothetical protein
VNVSNIAEVFTTLWKRAMLYKISLQGEHNSKYNDYNDSRQKITKYELEVERLRQENDR